MSASRVTTVPAPDRATPDRVPAPDQVPTRDQVPARDPVSTPDRVHMPGQGPAPDRPAIGRGTGIRAELRRRALDMLPPGTLTVGAGLLVLGAGYYAHLAVAGHSLTASGMAALSVLWSIVFLLGLACSCPSSRS